MRFYKHGKVVSERPLFDENLYEFVINPEEFDEEAAKGVQKQEKETFTNESLGEISHKFQSDITSLNLSHIEEEKQPL